MLAQPLTSLYFCTSKASNLSTNTPAMLAQPLTSLRTSALLRGQLPASTVPQVDDMTATAGMAQDSILDEPAYGTHERQA